MKLSHAILLPLAGAMLLAGCKQAAPGDEPTGAPASEPSALPGVPTGEQSVRQSAGSWIKANYQDMGKLLYAEAETDLDGDGMPEIVAYVGGPMLCGTGGCNLVVLKRDGMRLRKVSELSVVQLPVGVLDSKSNGWRDLAVTVAGGGEPAHIVRLAYEHGGYPENPTVAQVEQSDSIGTVLIAQGALKPVK
jgi:hypothetical protein